MLDALTGMMSKFAKWPQRSGKNSSLEGSVDIGTSFEFVDGNKFNLPGALLPAGGKVWSDAEKGCISEHLKELCSDAPGLMQLATVGAPIKLVRVRNIDLPSGKCHGALTGEQTVLFSDLFFARSNMLQSLAHECVHLADSDSAFVAFSKEWVQLAEPLIGEFNSLKNEEEKAEFLRTKWPSEYACLNMHEALAEYVAAYVGKRYFESKSAFEKTVQPMLFQPDAKAIRWKKLVVEATAARNASNLKLARRILLKTASLFPSKPYSHLHLAGIAATLGDLETTKAHTEDMIKAFGLIGAASMLEREYLQLISRTFYGCGKKVDADAFVRWIATNYPADSLLFEIDK